MEAFLFDSSHDSYASRQRRAARHQEHEGGVSQIPIVEWEELVCLEDFLAAKPTKGNKEARRAAALRLVCCGELSRASRVFTSSGLAPSTADTTKKLALKHPPRVKSIDLLNTPHSEAINLSENVFYDAVRRSPRGSGVGPSGWRFEHFKVLIDNENTAKCLFSACSAIAKGILPPEIAKRMSSSRMITLPKKTVVHLLGETFVNDQVWKQACLSICVGGFGLTPLSSIAGPAFVASWSHTISELPSRFPHLKVIIDKFTCDASSLVGHAFRSYLPTNKKISDYKGIKKLQHQLSMSNFKEDFQHLVDAAPTARDEARFCSLQVKSAGAWLHALPTSYGFALNPCEFCLAFRVRLGLPVIISKWVESCNCNAPLDDSGYHLITCKTGGGPIWSLESIAGVWSECRRSLRIHHCREPRNRCTNSECRPDIIMFDAESGSNIDLDISLAHAWSSDVFPSSAEATGFAAN